MAACLRCLAVYRCGARATATAFAGPDVRVCSLSQVLKHLTPLPDLFLAARVCQVRASLSTILSATLLLQEQKGVCPVPVFV